MRPPIVWDIDGTLTAESYTPDNLETLRENPTMVLLAMALQNERPMIVSTARPSLYRPQTVSWLKKHGLKPDLLLMRSDDENQFPDQVVKERHLDEILSEFGAPALWVDDNTKNCDMLERRGIPCLRVKQ